MINTDTNTNTSTFRKTKKGQWVVYGPAAIVRPGVTVAVSKRDGTLKMQHIDSVGRTFKADGRDMVYGYTGGSSSHRSSRTDRCVECGGTLSDFDRRAASVPGHHFDCA